MYKDDSNGSFLSSQLNRERWAIQAERREAKLSLNVVIVIRPPLPRAERIPMATWALPLSASSGLQTGSSPRWGLLGSGS